MDYAAREQEADFLMNQVFNVQENWSRIEAYQEFSEELVRAIVAEGGRLAAEVMAPLNEVGDTHGCQLQDGEVTTPPGFKEAFAQLTEGGWLGLTGNPKFGGQGMPKSLAGLIEEMFWAANSSLFLYGSLTVGACLSIDAHGSAEQKNTYLEKALQRPVDGSYGFDRIPRRHRPRHDADQGGTAGRRLLPNHRHQDFHHQRRARYG